MGRQSAGARNDLQPGETLSLAMADYVLGFGETDIARTVLEKARDGFIDFLASAIDGISTPAGQSALGYAEFGSDGPCAIVGTAVRLPAEAAALVSGAIAHSLIRDDTHVASGSHLSVVVWPALMAIAQAHGATGRAMLTAGIMAYEIGGRVGSALMTPNLMARFRPTGVVGPVAAAAGCALLLGLDRRQTASALGFAANMAAGFNEWATAAGHEAHFHAGLAARSAVTSVYLARAGAVSSPTAFEGRAGYFAAFQTPLDQGAILPLSRRPRAIMDAYWKPFPACNFVQAPCQAALGLTVPDNPATVACVTVRCPSAAIGYPGCDNPGPYVNALDAKMSIQFSVAAALLSTRLDETHFARFDDPSTLDVARKVRLVADPDMDAVFPSRQPAAVEVLLTSGETLSASVDNVLALPARIMRERFLTACARQWSPEFARATLTGLDRLLGEDDFSSITGQLFVA